MDLIAPALSRRRLSVRLGQPVVVENRPGSGSNLAGDIAAKSAPDGYTLFHGPDNVFMSNPHIYGKMPFDPFKDLVPVASLSSNQLVLAVHPSVPANNLREFVELARRTKPPLFYASIGNGSQHHLAMEMLKQHVGIDLIHVPYRGGGPAGDRSGRRRSVRDVRRRLVVPTVQSGKVRGLASTGSGAQSGNAGAADHRRALSRLRGADLARPVRAGRHAAADHRPAARGDRSGAGAARRSRSGLPISGSGEPYITTPEEFCRPHQSRPREIRQADPLDRRQDRAERYCPIQPTIAPMISSRAEPVDAVDHGEHRLAAA